MTMPLMRPKRKNPVQRTRQMNVPPWARGRVAMGLTVAAAEGRFELQVCQDCGTCSTRRARPAAIARRHACSGARSRAQASCCRHHAAPQQRPVLPRTPALAAGPGAPGCRTDGGDPPAWRRAGPGARVTVGARLDRAGRAVLIAFPPEETPHMADDPMLREMTCDPKMRKILVTDGMTAVGQATVRALVKAGADIVWVGHAEPWKRHGSGLDDIPALARGPTSAGDPGAAGPEQRTQRDRTGRRDRRQGRHRDQQRRSAPHVRHRRAARHRRGACRDGHQLLRPAAAGAGLRPGAEGPRRPTAC
jgi:hypothetical protein